VTSALLGLSITRQLKPLWPLLATLLMRIIVLQRGPVVPGILSKLALLINQYKPAVWWGR
jgi:hypothetical protein